MNEAAPDSAVPVCARHPDRVSYVRCQRCARPCCGDCQRSAAVGVQCADCVHTAQAGRDRDFRAAAIPGPPKATYVLIGICVLVFVGEFIPSLNLLRAFQYAPLLTEAQPWRMFTSIFTHSQSFVLHIAVNMYSLYVLGQVLEPVLGRLRFTALFVVSGFAGSVGVLFLSPPIQPVVGASGAIFGFFGALFVLQLHHRSQVRQVLVLLVINLGLGFMVPGISWQAHIGGLIGGVLVGLAFIYLPRGPLPWLAVAAVLSLLVALSLWQIMQLRSLTGSYGLPAPTAEVEELSTAVSTAGHNLHPCSSISCANELS